MEAGLADRTLLVTGASGGIGRAIARAFAGEGAYVGLHWHTNEGGVTDLAGGLRLQADLRDERAVEAMFAALAAERGRIDGIVVNAGVWVPDDVPLRDMTLGQWEDTFASNLRSAFLTCRAFLRHLAAEPREDASIVLVGSTAALVGEEGHADYAASKAGLAHGLTATLKNEIVRIAPRGRVNCVCPGWVATPMVEDAMAGGDDVQRATKTMALRKIASPEDVARAVVFLTSPRLAGHVTGAILPVTGGMEGRVVHP